MNHRYFKSLYEQCIEEVDHVPLERRSVLLDIAETFNRLANECVEPGDKRRSLKTRGHLAN